MASRHLSRALVLQTLFESDMTSTLTQDGVAQVLKRNAKEFDLGAADLAFAKSLVEGIVAKREEVDAVIQEAAPQWPIAKIAPIDRNVLRIGLYELLFGDRTSVPPKVALNEAIEIAKSFGGEQSGKFVNGVLGSVYRDIGEPQKADTKPTAPSVTLAGAVVVSDDHALVALVKDVFHRWTLPKSELQEGELTESAARRAIENELGLTAKIIKPLGEHSYVAHDPKGRQQKSVSYFLAEAPVGAPLQCTVCDGIVEAGWFAKDELEKLPMYDEVRSLLLKTL